MACRDGVPRETELDRGFRQWTVTNLELLVPRGTIDLLYFACDIDCFASHRWQSGQIVGVLTVALVPDAKSFHVKPSELFIPRADYSKSLR